MAGRERLVDGGDDGIRLFSVVGNVPPSLFSAFIRHYRGLGVDDEHITFHFPDGLQRQHGRLLRAAERLGVRHEVRSGPWHETTNKHHLDRMRARHRGWQVLADSDEFAAPGMTFPELVAESEREGRRFVSGLMLDRVAGKGRLIPFPDDADADIDRSFPFGGFFTAAVVKGSPFKVVLAKRDLDVRTGNHVPSEKALRRNDVPRVPVHHFKWHGDVIRYLDERVAQYAAGDWQEESVHARHEAERSVTYLRRHGGIRLDEPGCYFREVSLREVREDWMSVAAAVTSAWKQAVGIEVPSDRVRDVSAGSQAYQDGRSSI